MDRHDTPMERDLADAVRRLKEAAGVPPVDPAREAALLAAFDAGRLTPSRPRRDYWYLGAFAAAAALIVAWSLPRTPALSPVHGVRFAAPGEFTIVPGASALPPMESGTLVRMDVPVSMLPSLGVTPPPGQATEVTADLVVAQDGLPRAVRLVSP